MLKNPDKNVILYHEKLETQPRRGSEEDILNSYGRGEDNRSKSAGSVITRETFGMTLLLFSAVLLVISIIGTYMLGEIGTAINAFLLGAFGFALYPLLVFGIYASLVMITGKKLIPWKWIGRTACVLASALLIAHLATSASLFGESFGAYMSACWTAAEASVAQSTGGGVLFGLIVYPCRTLLTEVGAYVLFSLLAAVSLFFFLKATPLGRLVGGKREKREKKHGKREKAEEGGFDLDDLTPSRRTMGHAVADRYDGREPAREERDGEDRTRRTEAPSEDRSAVRPSQQPYGYQSTQQQPYGYQPAQQQPYGYQPAQQQPYGYQPTQQQPYDGRSVRATDRDVIYGSGYEPPRSEPSRPISGRDILFSDPARDFNSNLIFRRDSDFNTRERKSSVRPQDGRGYGSSTEFDPFERPAAPRQSYSERYERKAEEPRPGMPRRVTEVKPDLRGGGYTLRAEDLNYPVKPSYKSPETPLKEEQPDEYAKDVPFEEPAAEDLPDSFEEIPEAPRGSGQADLHRAPVLPEPEPVKSEPRTEPREEPVIARGTEEKRTEEKRTEGAESEFRSLFSSANERIESRSAGSAEPVRGAAPARGDSGRELTQDLGRNIGRDLAESAREPGRGRGSRSRAPEKPDLFGGIEDLGREVGESLGDLGRGRTEAGGSRAIDGLRSNADLFDEGEDEAPGADVPVSREREGRSSRPEEVMHDIPSDPAPLPKKHVYKPYRQPMVSLLREYNDNVSVSPEEVDRNSQTIVETLSGFRVDAEIMRVTVGPAVTRYDIDVPKNISVGMVTKRDAEIAMRLHARDGVNMYANNESGAISIEVPNSVRATVGLRSVMQSEEYLNARPNALMFAIGKDIEGRSVCGNIAKMKHLLVAGATGSGKSVCLNAMLISLICKYSPEDLRLILIDPKKVEFTVYDGLPHLMINEIVADAQKAVMALNWSIKEMERRYDLFEQKTRSGNVVRNLDEYNSSLTEDEQKLPKIVIVVDELADLMSVAKKDIEERIQRIAQKARAAGIHLVIATQRPSVDVITGVIKGNLPTRIAFRVIQEVDSRTILDESGAEKLLGLGDMLYKTEGMFNCSRVQGAFISSEEVQAIVEDIKSHNEAYFDPDVSDYINHTEASGDGGYDDDGESGESLSAEYIRALGIVVKLGSASISLIQRKCSVGYNHAGKIMEWMETMGYVSPFDGKAKARTVLLTKEEYENTYGSLD